MNAPPTPIAAGLVELLDDAALTLDELARGCRVSPGWVVSHVEAGVLLPAEDGGGGGGASAWRFAAATLTRARRVAQLESAYEADPQLAALAVDLMEEVARLRRLLPP